MISNIVNRCNTLCITLSKNQDNPINKNLIEEHIKALTSLGIREDKIILGDFTTRNFSTSRQKICDHLLKIKKEHDPDIIFTHSFSDMHQDHEVVSKEVLRIFKRKTILGFEIPPSSYNQTPNFFFEVSEQDVNNKICALMCYTTYKDKNYFSQDLIKAPLIKNGVAIEKRYAEAFDVIRLSHTI